MESRELQEMNRALGALRERLEPEGWTVSRSRRAIKARWNWYRISLRYSEKKKHASAPWRARLRDRFPPVVLKEQRATTPKDALDTVVAHARLARAFCEGELGLAPNPSKSWLAHRVWSAVRKQEY